MFTCLETHYYQEKKRKQWKTPGIHVYLLMREPWYCWLKLSIFAIFKSFKFLKLRGFGSQNFFRWQVIYLSNLIICVGCSIYFRFKRHFLKSVRSENDQKTSATRKTHDMSITTGRPTAITEDRASWHGEWNVSNARSNT